MSDAAATAESSASWQPANWVDPRERFDWGAGERYDYVYQQDQREDGKNRPIIETQDDVYQMQSVARFLVDTNPYGRAYVENLTNYTIGTGFQYTAATKKKRQAPEGLVEAVQDVIDEFLDLNDWQGDLERETFLRTLRDGESFPRLHRGSAGIARVRMIEPEYLREPSSPREIEQIAAQRFPDHAGDWRSYSWSFGIQTPQDDVCDAVGYYVDWSQNGADWEYIPAFEVEHIKAPDNSDRNVKRGVTDFYSVAKWLAQSLDLLGGTISGATIQSKIAMITEYEQGASADGVRQLVAGNANATIRRATDTGSVRETKARRYEDGTILHIPAGRKHMLGAMGTTQGPMFMEVLQGGLRAVAARRCMPEHMISADASNNNFASILEAASPFRKAIESLQSYFKRRFSRLFWRVLLIAFNSGRFDRFGLTWQAFKQYTEIQIEAPTPEVTDRNAETDRRIKLVGIGAMSLQTLAGQEGLDYELEQQNGAAPAAIAGMPAETATGGEFRDLSRRQYQNVTKAMRGVLDDLISGKDTADMARERLSQIGVADDRIERLVSSAADGKVDDAELEAAESASLRREVVTEAVRQLWESYP